MAAAQLLTRHTHVLLYIPNLIGYARVLLTLGALACARRRPLLCAGAYFFAFVCDELDGRAARAFNQTSTLGAVLDMVTDRVATTGLLALLCGTYPAWHSLFICLIALDIFSHWFQMHQTLLAGSSTHKDVHSRSRLVRLYYSNRLFMGFCCVCCEVAYLALFLLHVPAYRTARPWLLPLRLPAAAAAAVSAAAGGGWGAYLPAALPTVAREWAGAGVPLLGLVVLAALPGVLVKQACNWVQLRAAVAGLVEHDVRGMSSSSSGAAAQRHAPSARVKAQ